MSNDAFWAIFLTVGCLSLNVYQWRLSRKFKKDRQRNA